MGGSDDGWVMASKTLVGRYSSDSVKTKLEWGIWKKERSGARKITSLEAEKRKRGWVDREREIWMRSRAKKGVCCCCVLV